MKLIDQLAEEHEQENGCIGTEYCVSECFKEGFKQACEMIAEAANQLCVDMKVNKETRHDITSAIEQAGELDIDPSH